MKHWIATAICIVSLTALPAFAVDLVFDLRLASPSSEPLTVTIAYDGLYPVYTAELATGDVVLNVSLTNQDPGSYQLYIARASRVEVDSFDFVFSSDNSVLFTASPAVDQQGSAITIAP